MNAAATFPLDGAGAFPAPSPLDAPRRWLAAAPEPVFAIYAGLMAFGTYFAMYAFRKPFAVASFAGVAPAGIFGFVDYKIALVIAQVAGYAIAKLIGVKVIAELPARLRIWGILAQIGAAELALVGFGLIPAPWNIACLFLDGLALGMVWGMVFGFVEGRRQSDLIGAMLCASFILSSGVVKSVGETVLLSHIASQFWSDFHAAAGDMCGRSGHPATTQRGRHCRTGGAQAHGAGRARRAVAPLWAGAVRSCRGLCGADRLARFSR